MIVFLAMLCFFLYFFPWFIAAMRKHNNIVPIALANLFFGWTVIVWLFIFIWSFSDNIKDFKNVK